MSSNAQSETSKYDDTWGIWVTCDGVFDIINGPGYVHKVKHFDPKTGVQDWFKLSFKSDKLVSMKTGEVFSVNFYRKLKISSSEAVETIRFNLRGDAGSHILVTRVWLLDIVTGEWTETDKTKCM